MRDQWPGASKQRTWAALVVPQDARSAPSCLVLGTSAAVSCLRLLRAPNTLLLQ